MARGIFRYPGSKAKLSGRIIAGFPPEMQHPLWMQQSGWEYREPFVGAGGIAIDVLSRLPDGTRVWLNDIDFGIACMWQAIQNAPHELCELIESFSPSALAYYRFKDDDGKKNDDPVETGFRKLALHQMSYGGLGAMSGGPLGGRSSDNPKYPPSCRWNAVRIINYVDDIHKLLKRLRVKVTCKDFGALFVGDAGAFLYCDPPYYVKGPQLYKYSFTDDDHVRLRDCCEHSRGSWFVSYDDAPFIRDLYSGFGIESLDVHYMQTKRKNREIVISNVDVEAAVA